MTKDELIENLIWFIEVQTIFYHILYRPLDRKVEYPLWLRNISSNGIGEIFKIYETALNNIKEVYINES